MKIKCVSRVTQHLKVMIIFLLIWMPHDDSRIIFEFKYHKINHPCCRVPSVRSMLQPESKYSQQICCMMLSHQHGTGANLRDVPSSFLKCAYKPNLVCVQSVCACVCVSVWWMNECVSKAPFLQKQKKESLQQLLNTK